MGVSNIKREAQAKGDVTLILVFPPFASRLVNTPHT